MSLHYLVKYECQKTGMSEICIVINDKLQGSTAKHLSYDVLLHYKFIIQFAGERISIMIFLKSVNIWRSYRQNGCLVSYAPFA